MEENRDKTAVLPGQLEDHPDRQEWYEIVSFQDAKAIIRANLATAARSFIAIGFYLKHIRDQELYREDGFGSIWEFAQAEYGISKSTASRYMAMNDRFSEGGNTPLIQEQYKQFNKSQLQEMLSLDEEQLGKVTPADRVEDIRTMKKPREIPYVDLPGQISIAELTGIDPEEPAAAGDGLSGPEEEEAAAQPQPYTLTVDQLIGEAAEGVAISQQEQGELDGWCLHRQGFSCDLPEEAGLTVRENAAGIVRNMGNAGSSAMPPRRGRKTGNQRVLRDRNRKGAAEMEAVVRKMLRNWQRRHYRLMGRLKGSILQIA